MSEALQKFKEDFSKVETVAIYFGKHQDPARIIGSAILQHAFSTLKKTSHLQEIEGGSNNARVVRFFFENLSSGIDTRKNIIISIDTESIPVSELKYEKDGSILNIIIENGGIGEIDNISITKEKASVDLLLLVDPPENEIEQIIQNTPHRDIVRLTTKDRILASKITDILNVLFDGVPDTYYDPLWFLAHIEDKNSGSNYKDFVALQNRLMHCEINYDRIRRAKEALWGSTFWKLLGRALVRSEYERQLKTLWVFLSKDDFTKTAQNEHILQSLTQELSYINPEAMHIICLWDDSSEEKCVQTFIKSSQLEIRNKFLNNSNKFQSFSEAELFIRKMLRDIISKEQKNKIQ
jgi:hypothetical protein